MLPYPNINPIAFRLGPLKVHWYGLMYLVGFFGAWWLGTWRARKPHFNFKSEEVSDLLFYVVLGVILGGRIGYVLFYNFWLEVHHPWYIFKVWDGGMSFHGGLLGVVIAMGWYGWRTGKGLFTVADFVAPLVPIGLFAGRIGNFINGELWGRVTTLPWGMVFPGAGPLPRHPSQLYEAFLEGIVLFVVLMWYSSRPRPRMTTSGLFLLLYGIFRFLVEFVRAPDPQLGFVAFGWMTRGQELSLPMIFFGMVFVGWGYWRARRYGMPEATTQDAAR